MGEETRGFVREAVYTDGADAPIGGRFVHKQTGLLVRVLGIESVPQVFLNVCTPPVSERGEPHTQEHLLLGKGRRGRTAAAAEEMSLVESSAYTDQTDTCYSFNCAAGKETFFQALERNLEALLFPDYTDEEIRREVWHVGASEDPETGELQLEERGTIYNEMVTTYEKRWNVFYEMGKRLHGPAHPFSFSAGGAPGAVREITPERIHTFHASTYHLSSNMGIIASLPPTISTDEFLQRLDGIIGKFASRPEHEARPRRLIEVPPSKPSADHSLLVVPYPNQNEQDTGNAVLAWAPQQRASVERHVLWQLFLEAFGGGETSYLYRMLLDKETRKLDVSASEIWAGLDETVATEGAMIGFSGYSPSGADAEHLDAIANLIRGELELLAALEPGDAALAEFNLRVETRLLELGRELKRRLSMPPLFGQRHGGGFWLAHLRLVDSEAGDHRALTLDRQLAAIRAMLDGKANPWGAVIAGMGLLDAPYIGVSVPSAAEVERRAADRRQLLADALVALKTEEGTTDDQAAMRALAERYDAATAELEERDATIAPVKLVDDVPLTLDDTLISARTTVGKSAGGGVPVPAFRAHFEAMSAVEAAVIFKLEALSPGDLVYLPLVPSLLTGAGLRPKTGDALPYDALQDLIAREIGGVGASFDSNPQRGRHELVVSGSGVDRVEGERAIAWIERCLTETDLTEANLPRLRTLVQQAQRELRQRLGGSEESWVHFSAAGLRFQANPLYLSTGSLHTQIYHLFRLQWMLEARPTDAPAAMRLEALIGELTEIADLGGTEAEFASLRSRFGVTPVEGTTLAPEHERFAQTWARPILDAIEEAAGDLPRPAAWLTTRGQSTEALRALNVQLQAARDQARTQLGSSGELDEPAPELTQLIDSLDDTIRQLGLAIAYRQGLSELVVSFVTALDRDPREVLHELENLLARLYSPARARLVLTGRPENLDALTPGLERLLGVLEQRSAAAAAPADSGDLRVGAPLVRDRVVAREQSGPEPAQFAFVNESSSSGVFLLSAAAAGLEALDRDTLTSELAASVYAGGGPHGFFMNTWAAGLAYSNGTRTSAISERSSYYAERCPDLVQTMQFVTDLATHAETLDPGLAEYAIANLVSHTRASDGFEDRARAQAADLEDGITPEKITAYRKAVLALRKDPELWNDMLPRIQTMTGRVLVGLGARSRTQDHCNFLVIAPERLIAGWEDYVRANESSYERVHRIFPADMWVK